MFTHWLLPWPVSSICLFVLFRGPGLNIIRRHSNRQLFRSLVSLCTCVYHPVYSLDRWKADGLRARQLLTSKKSHEKVSVRHKEINFLTSFFFFFSSASDAIKGEGLQEGLDWLQGKVFTKFNNKCHTGPK